MKFLAPIILAIIPNVVSAVDFYETDYPIVCGKTKEVYERLANWYKEAPVMKFDSDPGITTTIWINFETKTVSIISSHTNGTSCLVSGGENLTLLQKLI
jgi:hypothetical protein